MNRTLFSIAALFGALMPLVFDSALKGAVLLATAALVTLALWRASAAARHLVWLVAIVALLIVPVLSLALPQWRVLPQWAGGTVAVSGENRPYTPYKPYTAYDAPVAIAEDRAPEENLPPATAATPPPVVAAPAAPIPHPASRIPHPAPTWREWLPLAWCVGFAALAVRLLAAHLLLRRASRQCPALTAPPDEKIAAAFADACKRLGITQRVTLLLDKKRTIPVVWGVFRPRLMLPLEARDWSDEQLCSVLLHELGHIKRRDTLVQWLTQIACALHWWNPLVWLAAWRLHAERERACDDLVLASGVRPSAYAEHLLDVASRLSPARWTSACGLAMARKSSLEGRLMAVLSEKLNRNGVTRALAIVALVLGAAIALPVAMLRAAEEKWTAPSGAHIGGNDFSAFCIRDGNDTAFVIAYRGDFNSSTTSSSNAKARTWTDAGTITTVKSGIQIDFRREHTAPAKLTIAQKEYDLTKGRVFYLTAEGIIRQLDIPKRPIRDRKGADQLAKLVAGSGLSTGKGVRTQGGMRVYFGPSRLPEKEAGTFTVSPSGQEKAEFVLIALGKFRTADNSEQFPDTGKIRIAGEMTAPDGRIFAFSREPDSGHITVNGTPHILAEGRVLVFGPGERVRQLPVFPEAIPDERAPMPKFDTLKKLIREIPALSQPAAEAPKSTDAKNRDEQYVKSGIPLVELKEDVSWNGTQNGLSLGYRIIGDEWRILGKQVKVELWLRNIGNEGVKFQLNTRPDIGLRMKLKNAKGEEKMATIVPNDRPPFGEQRLLPPGHALKVKDFPISLFRPINDVSSVRDHYFPIEPGAYEFHCELELPGFSATGEGGKQLTPAAGEWTGKLTTRGVNVQVVDLDAPKSVLPKNQYARAHFAHLQKYARENGDIPGGLVALLDRSLANKDPKLDALAKRLDATRDWTAKETAEFLDAAAATGHWVGDDGRLLALEIYDIGRHGSPLPADLAALPWGKADDGLQHAAEATGLRAAFTLDPAAASYAQGTQLPVTVHFHNSGTAPLVFPVGFRSMDMAEAQDEQGRKLIAVWTFPNGDNGQMKDGPWKPKYSVRLEPGHWISVPGARLTIAAGRHSDTPDSHGIAMIAPTDSTVKLKWIPMIATWNEGYNKKPFTWKDRVAKRIEIVSPMPKSRADREKLLNRVTLDLTGEEATAAEVAAFIADDAPDALAKLTARFQALPPLARYAGWIKTGEQTFKVTSAPTDYRGTVMSANGPGLYELTDSVVLQHYGPHANFEFTSAVPEPHPRTIELKDKESLMAPHGIVWRHGSGIAFVAEKERVRKYDFSGPGTLTETNLPAGLASIPEELRAELVKAFPSIETAAATEASKGAAIGGAADSDTPKVASSRFRELLNAVFYLPKAKTWELKVGERVRVKVDGVGDFMGEVFAIAEKAEPRSGLLNVKVALPENNPRIRAGLIARFGEWSGLIYAKHPFSEPSELLGTWRGKLNDKNITLSFHRPPAETVVHLDIYEGEATIGMIARFNVAEDGKSAVVVLDHADSATYGTLRPGENGALKLELDGRQKGQTEVSLTRDADVPATEPRQKEARELFELWKRTANDDGTIPGTFIGMLATEVRAYLKANPNLDSAAKMPKLLPRFDTRRAWTQAEAIALLDDVAYYSTAPITARVAKAKLGADALWRTKVEFQDIPVGIVKWSEPLRGLRVGMHMAGGEWRIGGKVRLSLWLHNTSDHDITFDAAPASSESGVTITAVDAEGGVHRSHGLGSLRIAEPPKPCTLPAGYVAEVKSFELPFENGNPEQFRKTPMMIGLKPGTYKLTSAWSDSAGLDEGKEWRGTITAPEVEFTLAAAETPRGGKLPDSAYPKVGVPYAELDKPMEWSGVETNGVCLGIHIPDDAVWRNGGEVKAEVWVCNAGETDVKLSHSPRADVGLSIIAKGPDGKEHSADITQFRGFPVFAHMLLPAGNIAMIKQFTIKLGSKKNDKLEPGWVNLDLAPGDYKLRAVWSDTTSRIAPEGEWTGKIATGEVHFKLEPNAKPQQARDWNDKYAAVAYHTADDVNFVLIHEGLISTGLSETWAPEAKRWAIEGNIHLVDSAKTKAAGQNVDKRVIPLKHTSDAPGTLSLDGRDYDLKAGRVFILRDEGAPEQLDKTMPLRNKADLEKLGGLIKQRGIGGPPGANIIKVPDDQYVKDGFPADELVGEGVMWNAVQNGLSLGQRITGDEWRILGKEVKVELWVRNSGDKDVKFQLNMRPDIGLRVKLKSETGVKGAKEVEHEAGIVPSDVQPFGELRLLPPGHALKVKEFTVSLFWPANDVSGIKGHYFAIEPGAYMFHCELELPGFSATGEGGKQLTPAAGEWTGKLTSPTRPVMVIAPDAPAPKPRIEGIDVGITKDGEIGIFGKPMPLDELKTRAARNAKKWFTIYADKDVPYAKVVEVVEALKAAGVTEIAFREARMGDGKYRVANRQAVYKLDDKHGFSICRPADYPQFFTVSWPAEGERPACSLKTYPNVSKETQGKWAVVWEPGTNVLWWVDDSDVGKMTFTDPAHVVVDREGRGNSFSRDFGLPDGVVTEFRRLGFSVGRIGQTGGEAEGNTRSQQILSAEKAGAKGNDVRKDAASPPKPDAVPAVPSAGVKPDSKLLFNEDYAAFAVQSEKDLNFVLIDQGNLSSGISEWSSGSKWRFEGNVYLVDAAKTAIAGKNVNKRAIPLKYTSDAPGTLSLDGQDYDLKAGRVFILRDEGAPEQLDKTMPLRNKADLEKLGEFLKGTPRMTEQPKSERDVPQAANPSSEIRLEQKLRSFGGNDRNSPQDVVFGADGKITVDGEEISLDEAMAAATQKAPILSKDFDAALKNQNRLAKIIVRTDAEKAALRLMIAGAQEHNLARLEAEIAKRGGQPDAAVPFKPEDRSLEELMKQRDAIRKQLDEWKKAQGERSAPVLPARPA